MTMGSLSKAPRTSIVVPFVSGPEGAEIKLRLQERRFLQNRNALDIRLHARAQELAELDFEYFRQVSA